MATVTITITDIPAIRPKDGVGSVNVDYAFDPPVDDKTENTAALHLASIMIDAANKAMNGEE
jgi:hypothetical protein